jgi:molecular chaperone GrpE
MSERGQGAEPRARPDAVRATDPGASHGEAGGVAGAADHGGSGSTDPRAAVGGGADVDAADETSAGLAAAEAAAGRIAELEDQRLRALADADNLRKRCARQVSEARAEARADVARRWLPVVDNLERALAHAEADPSSIIEGVRAVRDQAMAVLAGLGYPRRDDLGARFDPARHEAVAARPDPDAPDGSVVEVVAPGYGDGAGQLRPAQVVVARAG